MFYSQQTQWQIQDFPVGKFYMLTPGGGGGVRQSIIQQNLLKTALKWRKLDREGNAS